MTEKVISNKICPEKLQNLWQEKEYRNFPLAVTNYITADTSVCAEARMCWILLFTMAYYDKNWCIQISKAELAGKLNKDKSSIERYLRDLKKVGYLAIQNIRIRGVWLPSKITVIVPPALLQLLEAAPERKKNSKAKPLKLVVDNTTEYRTNMFHVEPDISQNTAVEPQPSYPQSCSKGILRSDGSKNNINHNKLYTNNNRDIDRSSKENKTPVVVISDEKKSFNPPIQPKQLDVIIPSNDSNLDNSKQIQELEQKLSPLKQQLKSLSITEKAKFYSKNMLHLEKELQALRYSDELSIFTEIKTQVDAGLISKAELRLQQQKFLNTKLKLLMIVDSELYSEQIQGNEIEKNRLEINKTELELKQILEISRRVEKIKLDDYLEGKGQRQLSDKQVSWLKESIGEIAGNDTDKIAGIANEIAFQVRFGNLQISYKTRQVMSVQHGLNVALMKLREGGWTKPSGMARAA